MAHLCKNLHMPEYATSNHALFADVFCSQRSYMCLAIHWDIILCGGSGLWPFWILVFSVCGRFGLWPFRFVAVPVCGGSGLWPFRFVAVMTCYHLGDCYICIGHSGIIIVEIFPSLMNISRRIIRQYSGCGCQDNRCVCSRRWRSIFERLICPTLQQCGNCPPTQWMQYTAC